MALNLIPLDHGAFQSARGRKGGSGKAVPEEVKALLCNLSDTGAQSFKLEDVAAEIGFNKPLTSSDAKNALMAKIRSEWVNPVNASEFAGLGKVRVVRGSQAGVEVARFEWIPAGE